MPPLRVPLPDDPHERSSLLRDQFRGLWIAVWENEIIAAAPTIDAMFESMDEQRLPEAAVSHVPDPELGVAVGLG
jgi:hypothetical protein